MNWHDKTIEVYDKSADKQKIGKTDWFTIALKKA
jgi:hypothetical protein